MNKSETPNQTEQNSVPFHDGASVMDDIREVNLSYLVLARRMLHEDFNAALLRLGFSEDVANLLRNMSSSQLVKMANCGNVLCRFRFDDYTTLSSLTTGLLGGSLQQAHSTILLARQPTERMTD